MLPELSIYSLFGAIELLIGLLGFWIAWTVRRPKVFRIKLATVFAFPFAMGLGAFVVPLEIYSRYNHQQHRDIIFSGVMIMMMLLYWREMRDMTTSQGFHRSVVIRAMDKVPDMVWMKDLDGKFTYTNESVRRGLLCCAADEAFGKTGHEIAEMARTKGGKHTFGEICDNSDDIIREIEKPAVFLEYGYVNGKFLALQVLKSPLFKRCGDGQCKMVGTIGIGRDLTYDYNDHEEISLALEQGDAKLARYLFEKHRDRMRIDPTSECTLLEDGCMIIDRCSENKDCSKVC